MFNISMSKEEAIAWFKAQVELSSEAETYNFNIHTSRVSFVRSETFHLDIDAHGVDHTFFNLDHSKLVRKVERLAEPENGFWFVYDLYDVDWADWKCTVPQSLENVGSMLYMRYLAKGKGKPHQYGMKYFCVSASVEHNKSVNRDLLFI